MKITSVQIVKIARTLVLVSCLSIVASAGLDPTFNAAAYGSFTGTVLVTRRQADGKILIAGSFQEVNGRLAVDIARLNTDGTVDVTFNPPDFYDDGDSPTTIDAIAIQSDGKIIVGGNYDGVVGDAFGSGPRRLNPDGSLDTTFNVFTLSGNAAIRKIATLPDDKIIIGGSSDPPGGGLLIRLHANGTMDASFSNPGVGAVSGILVQSDGKLIVSGPSTLKRVELNGAVDGSFSSVNTNNGTVSDMAFRPDGKILIGGAFSSLNGFPAGSVGLLNADGTSDPTFNPAGAGSNAGVFAVELLADGKILIAGNFSTYNTVERQHIARLNADGTLDTAFLNNPSLSGMSIRDIAVLNSGRIVAGDGAVSVGPSAILLNNDGTTDTSVEYVITFLGRVRRVALLSNGKVMIAGDFNYVNGVRRRGLARLNTDGTLDATFVPYFNSSAVPTISITTVLEQPDGKLLVAGINGFLVQRLNADGSQDGSFATPYTAASTIYDLALTPSGHVIAVGTLVEVGQGTRRVVRLLTNGQRDTDFSSPPPNNEVYCVVRQPDGKLVIGGDFSTVSGTPRGRVARLNQDGSLDTGFDTSTGAAGSVFNLAVQSDGKVIVAGTFLTLNGSNTRVRIGRLNPDGSLDTGFSQNIDHNVIGLTIQRDGKILVGGSFTTVGGVARAGLARLRSNGSLDTTFNASPNGPVVDIKEQPIGKFVVAGSFTRINNQPRIRVARLLISPTPFDFDGDGRADISVFRPSSGTWYELFSSNSQFGQITFGLNGDIAVPADFDGDGTTDEAIFRPGSGEFWHTNSSDNSAGNKQWGQAGDLPRPSDFDGDGKADFIVYRPSTSVWYRYGSTGQVSITQFGVGEDKPLVGDFDGDGKSDLAVFRPSTSDWWYAESSAGGVFRSIHWGQTGDVPTPADFDGDGKTDLAIFRPSTGVWYVLNSADQSYLIVSFGLSEDRPIPADYDGDGRADIAVFRPSTGVWYLMQSASGVTGVQWGISSDVPIPNSYVPQ